MRTLDTQTWRRRMSDRLQCVGFSNPESLRYKHNPFPSQVALATSIREGFVYVQLYFLGDMGWKLALHYPSGVPIMASDMRELQNMGLTFGDVGYERE
jgi:hypothetical protein